jgi:hypothetical protein
MECRSPCEALPYSSIRPKQLLRQTAVTLGSGGGCHRQYLLGLGLAQAVVVQPAHRSVRARSTERPATGTALLTQFLATFEEFPPRQRAASFTIDQAVEKLEAALSAGR